VALDSSSVANSIISEVLSRQGLDSSGNIVAPNLVTFLSKREINTIIASKISTYLKDNLKVKGSYTGLLSNGSPDPKAGTFYLKAVTVPLTGESMELKSDYSAQQASSGTPKSDWMTGIIVSLRATVFNVTGGDITVTGPTVFLASMGVPDLPTSANFKDNIANLVSTLFAKITSTTTTPTPSSLPAASSSPGIGTSTLLTFE
jgi:hypothetical protein